MTELYNDCCSQLYIEFKSVPETEKSSCIVMAASIFIVYKEDMDHYIII